MAQEEQLLRKDVNDTASGHEKSKWYYTVRCRKTEITRKTRENERERERERGGGGKEGGGR